MAATTSNGACRNITRLVDQLRQGKSIFSTKLGRWAPRLAEPPLSPIILRTDPVEDMLAMVASLRREFPKECKEISAPIKNIYDYFDHQDVHMHGVVFIQTVLSQIAAENAERVSKIEKFARRWMEVHIDRFSSIEPDTQEIYDESEKGQYHERFLQDALKLLKAYRVNPPPSKESSLELPCAIGIESTGRVTAHSNMFERRPPDHRRLVTYPRVPSGLSSAQSAITEPIAVQETAGLRQQSARFSTPQERPRNISVVRTQGDSPHTSNLPEPSTQQLGAVNASSQQSGPVEPLQSVEGRDMDYVFSNQMPFKARNAERMPGTAYPAGQPIPNVTRLDANRLRGKSASYHRKRCAGPQHASNANDSRMSSPQSPDENHLLSAVRNMSDGNRGLPIQIPPGLQEDISQFSGYRFEPLPEGSQGTQVTQLSLTPLQIGYPQRSPSFGQAANTYSSAENIYQGYHFSNVELPKFGSRAQAKGRRSSFIVSNQTTPQQPTMYAGNSQSYSRSRGQSRQNPRQGFSNDARSLPRQEMMGQREFSGESNGSRRSSSGSTYDSQGLGHTGWQRGHHRQHGSYRGGPRRSSLNQHISTDCDGVPVEGGFSHMGYFGGEGGSGDFGHLAHQTIKEDYSDGTHQASSNQEAAKINSDANLANPSPHEASHTTVAGSPIHTPGQQNTLVYPYEHFAPYHDPVIAQPQVTLAGFVSYHESFRGSVNLPGVPDSVYTRTNVPPLDLFKIFVSGDGLTSVQVERLFTPYGTIVKLAGPYPSHQTPTNILRKKTHFYVTYSNPVEARNALYHVQNHPLSLNNRLTALPGFHRQQEGSSTNRYWTAAELPNQKKWDTSGRARNDFHGPPNAPEPGPSRYNFHTRQTNSYSDGFGRGRRYSERRPDVEGGETFAWQPKHFRSPPTTPKKYKNKGKGKAKASSPIAHSEPGTRPFQPQKGEREGRVKYDDCHKSSDLDTIPRQRGLRCVSQGGIEQQVPTGEAQQDPQTNVSNKETKWRLDFSESRPISLANMISYSSKKRESSKKTETRSAKTPQLASDGSPSRKSRPAPHKSNTPDMNLERQTPGSYQKEKEKPGEIAADDWPALQKTDLHANVEQLDRTDPPPGLSWSTSSKVLDQRPKPAAAELAPVGTALGKITEDGRGTSSGNNRPRLQLDGGAAEQTEAIPVQRVSPLKVAETSTDRHAQEKQTVNAMITADTDEPIPETQTMAEHIETSCVSPRTAGFSNVTDSDPCKFASDSKAKLSVRAPEKAKAYSENPPDRAYPDVRGSFLTDGVLRTHPASITQTECSESWADLSEKNEPSSLAKHRNWRGDLSSATSMTDPESCRSSTLPGLCNSGPAEEEEESEPSPLKFVPTVETLASGSSSGGTSSRGSNSKWPKSSRRSIELNSVDYRKSDTEAREKEAGPTRDSEHKIVTSTKPFLNNTSGWKDLHAAAGPNTLAESSTTAWTGSGELKGKGKELTIDVPLHSPSQNSVTDSCSKSPKSGKKKERFDLVSASTSPSASVGPIATHMKKKHKPSTPTKLASKKKGAVNKNKEDKVPGLPTPAEARTMELSNAMTPIESELRSPPEESEVKLSSDAILQSPAAEISRRTPTPYASGSFKDIVQDEVVLPCTTQKEGRNRDQALSPGTTEFQQSFLRLISGRTGQRLNMLSFGNRGAGCTEVDPSEHSSSDNQDTDSTIEDLKDSKNDATITETAQEESAKARRSRNKNKTRKGKGNGKGKKKSRHASNSDASAALLRPAEFPTLPLESPGSSLGGGVDEQKMFPPLAIIPPRTESGSEVTEAWLRQVKSEQEADLKNLLPVDTNAVLRAFDEQKVEYDDFKASYGTERSKKIDRLMSRGNFEADASVQRTGLELDSLMNRGGLGIDLGSGSARNIGDVLGTSQGDMMPPTPATPTLRFSKLRLERGSISSSGKGTARPKSPPSGGLSTPPRLIDEQAAAMARLNAEQAGRVLQLLGKGDVVPSNIHLLPGFSEDSEKASPSPKNHTQASSECSTEIDLAVQERSAQAAKSPVNDPAHAYEVPSPKLVSTVQTGSAAVDLRAPVPEVEPSAKLENSVELQSSSEIHTPRPLSLAPTADLAHENITALRKNGEIILFFSKNSKNQDQASLPKDSNNEVDNEAEAPLHGSPKNLSLPTTEPLTPAAEPGKTAAPTPSSAKAMPPPQRSEISVTDSDFPSLRAAKSPSLQAASPSKASLALPHRCSSARSKLSEANIAALESIVAPPPHQGRHRGESIKSTSEFSTTSSVRRKLFSEAAANSGVNSPRRPEGPVGGGQSLQSFVGAPVLFSGSSPPDSPAQTSPMSASLAPSGKAVRPSSAGGLSLMKVAASDSPPLSPVPSPTLSSPCTPTAVPTLPPVVLGASSSSATLPRPPPSSFVAGRRRGAKRRRIPDLWISQSEQLQ